ncbi:MAG TPA: LPS export ABC transporter ATP-binding protein [Methylomusa anaerophila]|uniref:Lipopolysaccharide export system ATP-binding protein LptB n=1 Tax=Methylomusa anaerophila TaxID=1930071 RepID=A0A348AKI2_9FIRM|nr:LPS export ABC transporter ATP-binding protein [Methylomusa anaerophila]BBB91580.1 lipopolysaccharide export system ATP-binding protein LptB [Methylomusa anaerophila]HML89482.1 LPS export ABC transporter ATP-binding protein [Methylomusa anaerophila]
MYIETQDLIKTYKNRNVVNGVSLRVGEGQIVGLLGANGAGKTTTFYMIVGLERPNSGRIFINGEEVTHMPMYRRSRYGLGYLPQEASIFRKLTVEDNLLAILETTKLTAAERKAKMESLLEEFHVTHVRKRKGSELSGGERRRVEIARALSTDPHFILLDEPFAGVDPIAVADIQEIISYLKSRGIGVLITDHNVRETLRIVDHAYILNEGQILIAGDSDTIANSDVARKYYLGNKFSL